MRRKMMATIVALLAGGAVVGIAPAASAQVGYAPALCPPANTAIDAGTHNIGETFSFRLVTTCLWDPGQSIPVTVNGQSVGTKVADAGGGVNVTVTVISATELRVDDPVNVRGQCGENNAVGVGFSSAAQATETATAVFRVLCPAGVARSTQAGGVAFTGANVLRWGGLAAAMLIIGSMLVVAARRRRETGTA